MVWLKGCRRDLDTPSCGRRPGQLHAALGYPCIADGKVVGIVELYAFHGDALDESLVDGLDAACSQIGLFVVRELAEIAARRAGALQQAMFNSAAHALDGGDSGGHLFVLQFCRRTTAGLSGGRGRRAGDAA